MSIPIYLCNEVVRELDFRAQCAFARAVGYDGLEIAPFTLGAAPHDLSAPMIREFRSVAHGEGMPVAGLHWLLAAPEGLSITTADDAVWRRTVEIGRRLVVLCAELEGRYLVHGSPGQRRLEAGKEIDGRDRAVAYFAAMAAEAEKAGVAYLVEPLARQDTAFINSVDDALGIVRTVGSPALGTMIDCYATAVDGGNVAALLRRWLPEQAVGHIHFNDANRRGPGQGDLDFAPIVDVLQEFGYRGAIGIEPFVYEPDGMACAARAIGYVRGLMEARGAH
ncbi:MAG TPA: sugar phosphate isomerase/epimerase family protein [Rhizobiaceae bacterium]|nr:sugar phosphate isomerase/epimerase family protein [Rhizobiaceae bacterium]